jgi:hypothetical protein
MKSSCHFRFDHLGMPTQFSNSNSPVSVVLGSVLLGTNLYATALISHLNSAIHGVPFMTLAIHRCGMDGTGNTAPIFACWNMFTDTLPTNGHANVATRLSGKVFAGSLTSSGHICHSINNHGEFHNGLNLDNTFQNSVQNVRDLVSYFKT